MRKFLVECSITVEVTLDDAVIDRCVQNQDDEGVPRSDERGSRGWRNMYYPLDTAEKVAEHLAYNLAISGRRLSSLDGWADLDDSLAETQEVDEDYFAREIATR